MIRLRRRPKTGKAKNHLVFANGDRMELKKEESYSDDEHDPQTRRIFPPPPEPEEPALVDLPERYRCVAMPGAIARAGVELTSEYTSHLSLLIIWSFLTECSDLEFTPRP